MRVSAVIPAYNEEKTIGSVLAVLIKCPEIDEVIVVSDGSEDGTADVARRFPVQLVELTENRGKGGAMKEGVNRATGDVLLFLDADLIGLTVEHLQKMLIPVTVGEAEMVIGIFANGRFFTDLAQVISPYLSGQRVIKRSLLDSVDNMEMTRFGIEVALTRYARANQIPCAEVVLEQMSHVMKEEKLGLVRGFAYRLKMYWEILKVIPRRYRTLK
jgi:glycosyltransferase involved in cell wall biosynthesis